MPIMTARASARQQHPAGALIARAIVVLSTGQPKLGALYMANALSLLQAGGTK